MKHLRFVPGGKDLGVIPFLQEHLRRVGKSKLAGMMLLQRGTRVLRRHPAATDMLSRRGPSERLRELSHRARDSIRAQLLKAHKTEPNQHKDARRCSDEEAPLHDVHDPSPHASLT